MGKDAGSSDLFVASTAWRITAVEGLPSLFPDAGSGGHVQDRLYVVVSPTKNLATVLYNAWCGGA